MTTFTGNKLRKDVIKTKIKEIEESTSLVEENLPKKFKEFLELGIIKDGIYKRIEFAIENVLDICATINSDLDLGIPSSEEDIVDNLVKNRVIGTDMGRKIKDMKGFRNFLVHRYGKIDDRVAFDNIKEGLEDFSKFIREIENFLRSQK